MQQQYQGKPVTVVRDAQQGDQGFDQSQDQVLIRLDNGTEKVVQRGEVTKAA